MTMKIPDSKAGEDDSTSSLYGSEHRNFMALPEVPKYLRETMERDSYLPENNINPYLYSLVAIIVSTVLGVYISPYLHEQGVIMIYLLAVVLVASRYGMTPAMVTCASSLIVFDYFIVQPRWSFEPADPQAIFSFIVMFIVAISMGQLTARIFGLVNNLELRVQRRTAALLNANYDLKREVARRAEAEQKLQNTIRELADLNESLKQFARVASHDLQEPLRSLNGYSDLLLRRYSNLLDEKGKIYLDQIQQDAMRMENLIESILAHASVRERNLSSFKVFDLRTAVEEALLNLRATIDDTDAVVDCRNLPCVFGDRWQIVQLFQNLISNSIRYKGDKRPRITISASSTDGICKVSIKDNGIGIEAGDREEIFKMFYRIRKDSNGNHLEVGTGIGLAICKSVVKNHGGELWVESEPGKGSTFHFTLPTANIGEEQSEQITKYDAESINGGIGIWH